MGFLQLLLAIYCLKIVVYLVLSMFRNRKPSLDDPAAPRSVDIVLPMYNEETVIVKTIENLLNIDYPDYSIIVVDDGSTDGSFALVDAHFGNHPRVNLVHQANSGKSSALNRAMNISQKEIIICIDADTLVKPDVIHKILPYFSDDRVTAVSGYVKVGNRINALTYMQYMEYITVQNFDRSVFERVNGILVVPGALGAFRLSAVKEVGGFTSEALAEDCDITLRMLCRNYVIRNAEDAISFTEAPESSEMFFKQRVRWTVGLVQGLATHARELATSPNKTLAYMVVPYTWLYRILLPVLVPLADYIFVISYLLTRDPRLLYYYLACILVEGLTSLFILQRKGESVNPLLFFYRQRCFRHLSFIIYLNIFRRWLKGNLYGWGKIPRQGNVKLD